MARRLPYLALTSLLAIVLSLGGVLITPATADAQSTVADEIIDALTIEAGEGIIGAPALVAAPTTPVPTTPPAPTQTPVPTVTPAPTAAPTATPIPTVAPAPTAVPTLAPAPTAIPTPIPAVVAVPTAVPTLAPVPTAVPTVAPAPTPVPTLAPAPTAIPTAVPVAGSRAAFPADVAALLPASTFAWLDSTGWDVLWLQGPGPGRQAEARYASRTVVIWHETNRPASFWAGALGHELGHAVSFAHFSQAQRNEWLQLRGISSWSWVPGTPNDFSVGEGDFAEAFMSYLLGHQVRSVGGPVTGEVAAWIRANTPF